MQKVEEQSYWKSELGFGMPKTGKSTLPLTADQPILVLNFDNGFTFAPPGCGKEIWVQNYPPAEIKPDKDKNLAWDRPLNVAHAMAGDIISVRNQMMKMTPEIELKDHMTGETIKIPRPKTLILDGLVQVNNAIVDWILRDNNQREVGGDGLKSIWGPRLDKFNKMLGFIMPIPECHRCMNTWATDEMIKPKGAVMAEKTGVKIPDIGGKLDDWGPGMVDACLYFYTETENIGGNIVTKHYVQTKQSANVKCVGVRGRFDLPSRVDITINPAEVGKPGYLSPWERVWGKAVSNEKKL